jgi:transposase InsO family protein
MVKHGEYSLLHIVCRFSRWAISVLTNKRMTTATLCYAIYKEVFSWAGLPASIVCERDSRLTATAMRAITKYLQIKLKLSTAYHPQTDGGSERFQSTLLQILGLFLNHHHSDWSEHIPAMLYAHHNTIHSATGFTPHMLLFA